MILGAQHNDKTMKSARHEQARIRTVRITGGDYPVASIVRLRVEQALYGRGERIWPPARRLRWRSRKKCDLFLLAVGAPPLQVLSTVYWIFTLWSGREDLNLRHPAPKAGALPGCATPRRLVTYAFLVRQHHDLRIHLYKNVSIGVQATPSLIHVSAPRGSELSSSQWSKNVRHGSECLGSMTDTVLFFSRQLSQCTAKFRHEEHGIITESLRTNKLFGNSANESSRSHARVPPLASPRRRPL